jgi:RHS repeat-associated protein
LPVYRDSLEPVTQLITVTNTGTAILPGGLSISGIDYPWLTISPPVTTQDLGIGERVTFTITITETNQPVGDYYDLITISPNSDQTVSAQPFFLKVYVHPDLYTFTMPVTNTLNNPVPGAQVSFTKTVARVIMVDGEPGPPHLDPYFSRISLANSNGVATLPAVEEGTYIYEIMATGHETLTGTATIPNDLQNGQFIPAFLEPLPTLVFEPAQANTTVLAGDSAHIAFMVRNLGPGHATDFSITTPYSLTWLSAGLPYSVTHLPAGAAMPVSLFLNPPVGTDATTYAGNQVVVDADRIDNPAVLDITINVVTTATGELTVLVTDTVGAALAGAEVTLVSQTPRVIQGAGGGSHTVYDWQTAHTDANGLVTVTDLAAGDYTYYAGADGYYHQVGTVTVVPGESDSNLGINYEETSLLADPFSYTWTVVETEITDTYAITIEILYEALAPQPMLFVSPVTVCPPTAGEWLIVNVGTYTMTNLALSPVYPNLNFTIDPGHVPAELAPDQSAVVPFTVAYIDPNASTPREGLVSVTAVYGQNHNYNTTAVIRRCNDDDDDDWSWGHDNGVIIGSGSSGGGGGNPSPTPPLPPGAPPPPPPSNHGEQAYLALSGNAFLTRQAFRALMTLTSHTADLLEDFTIDIEARDENGQAVVNGFAVTPTLPTQLGTLSAPGQTLNGEWLLVPGDLGITQTNGAPYYLRAQIEYTRSGQTHSLLTLPQQIIVYPQPQVRLRFSHSQPDENGDFYVELVADNEGYGVARNLSLELNNITVLADLDGNGRSLIFSLKDTLIETPGGIFTGTTGYTFTFGDLAPGAQARGRWTIGVEASDGEPLDNPTVTGFRVSCKQQDYQGLQLSPLIIDCGEIQQYYLTSDCPFCGIQDKNRQIGGPINTFNGNYDYSQSTPRLATASTPLQFTWMYNSLNSGASPDLPAVNSSLGVGWSHNYDLRLDLSFSDTITFHSPRGNNYTFHRYRDTFQPAPGVWATLESAELTPGQTVYTITARNQAQYVFDSAGRITSQSDPQSNTLIYQYHVAHDHLERIIDLVSQRYLELAYDDAGRLVTVSDPISRTTRFAYNELDHLTTITDTQGHVWQYSYTQLAGGQYLLSVVTDPEGRIVEQTGFDDFGRATSQIYNGQAITITYHNDGRRVIVNALGQETIHIYNSQGLLVATTDAGRQLERFVLDENQNRISAEDRNGNPTFYEQTPLGYYTTITNALGYTTQLDYDERNNWTQRVDARGQTILYDYDEHGNLITETNQLDHTKVYAYNDQNQLISITDENGVTTLQEYDAWGQLAVITNALGQVEYFDYDMVGRLITATDTTGKVTVNVYDAGDNLIQVTENYLPNQPQNYQHEYNLITQYEYDKSGRQTIITDTLGRTNLTLYDDVGRVVTQVTNYDGVTPVVELCTDFSNPDPEYNLCQLTTYDVAGRVIATTDSLGRVDRTIYDNLGRVAGTVRNWSGTITGTAGLIDCLALLADRDSDICSLYAYDALGNGIIMTDTVGRMTRTFYDAVNRVEGMILNWDGQATLDDCLTLSPERDDNVCTLFAYDEVGNTIIVTDTHSTDSGQALGRMTRTFYDELGRVEATVANWNPATLASPGDCLLAPDNDSDENICTRHEYDAAGRQTLVTDALGRQTLTVYDAANRPFITVANWDGTPITSVEDCAFPPAQPDTNICTVTLYDQFGRPAATQDALGNMVEMGYDSLGRVVTMTRYLDDMPVQTGTAYDAAGRRISQTDAEGQTTNFLYDSLNRPLTTISPGGVVMTQTYDAAGRVVSTTNNLNQVTVMGYDALGRLLTVRDGEGNVTSHEYDVLGNQTAVIDANGVRTAYGYDALDRLVFVVENEVPGQPASEERNILTQYIYDVAGNMLRTINGRDIVSSQANYDSLNRPISVTDALSNTTSYRYNALGLRTVITDANGQLTTYQYDGLGRVITVTYEADSQVVAYTYNALGHRLAMHDDSGLTAYEYDSLYRLRVVTETLTGTVRYDYDLNGNRTQLTYPDGKVVTYTYGADNRLLQVDDWAEGVTTYDYDAAGRLITTTLPNGVVTTNHYDNANRLTRLSHNNPLSETLLADYQYQLDGIGNRIVATETLYLPGTTEPLSGTLVSAPLAVDQERPAIAYNSLTDEYLVVWQDYRSGSQWDVYGQRLADDGSLLGDNFLIVADGHSPTIAYSPADEAYLVAFVRGNGVFALPVTASGPGSTFTIHNNPNPSDQPAITYNPVSEQFLIAWHRFIPSIPGHEILVRPATASGVAGWPVVAETSVLNQFNPVLAAANDGSYLLTWQRDGEIVGHLITQTVALDGSRFAIGQPAGSEARPAVAWNPAAQAYFVAWEDDDPGQIRGRTVTTATQTGTLLTLTLSLTPTQVVLTTVGDEWTAVWANQGSLYSRAIAANGSLAGSTQTLFPAVGQQQAPAVAGNHQDRYLVGWQAPLTTTEAIYAGLVGGEAAGPGGLQTTTIHYDYDPLYRLRQASYTGNISATYSYIYDSVGNMTAFTETTGITTTRVIRTFDNANRLQTSFDYDQGTTSYLYDNNGNLTLVIPPNDAPWQHYTFDQRNLMVSHSLSDGGVDPQLQATFLYDGAGNRVQQTDYSGSEPTTTSYTNDIVGLAQVLVANDDTTAVYNLWGLRLLAQDDGQTVRLPLTDGLGSVRLEMVADVVESTTTYDPYGNLLVRSGVSGTAYGFTGEQHDESTGLLYLRARYYNPALRTFMGKDAWDGDMGRPQSMNGWSYVENNPINLIDPTGMFPEWCKTATKDWWYADCVRLSYLLAHPWPPFGIWPTQLDKHKYNGQGENDPFGILGSPGCYYGAVPYRAPGHMEGIEFAYMTARLGEEMVYNFATFERREFRYVGAGASLSSAGVEMAWLQKIGAIRGFPSWGNLVDDYYGSAIEVAGDIGLSTPGWLAVGLNAGISHSRGLPNFTIFGVNGYMSVSGGLNLNPLPFNLDIGGSLVDYSLNEYREEKAYIVHGVLMKEMFISDILTGDGLTDLYWNPRIAQISLPRMINAQSARRHADIYIDMHKWRNQAIP